MARNIDHKKISHRKHFFYLESFPELFEIAQIELNYDFGRRIAKNFADSVNDICYYPSIYIDGVSIPRKPSSTKAADFRAKINNVTSLIQNTRSEYLNVTLYTKTDKRKNY